MSNLLNEIITDIIAFLVELFILLLLLGACAVMICGIVYLISLTITALK